jgi:tight adherence protein B
MSANLAVLVAASATLAIWVLARLAWRGAGAFLEMQHRLAQGDLASMFIFLDGRRIAAGSVAIGLLLALCSLVAQTPWPVVLLGLVVGLSSPRIIVGRLRKARARRLYAQLPDALQAWAGLLSSGHGMNSALSQLAERQARPLGDELRMLVRQSRMGVPVDGAFDALCRRIGAADLMLMSTLLRVTHELGGNLGESLLRLAGLLRARQAVEARIRSLTAQGRLQGLIVGLLPLALMVVLCFMEPEAMAMLFRRPAGWAVLALIAVLEAGGFLLIRRIVAIDV